MRNAIVIALLAIGLFAGAASTTQDVSARHAHIVAKGCWGDGGFGHKWC